MMNILSQIVDIKKEEVVRLRKNYTRSSFKDFEFYTAECLSLYDALSKAERLSVIAEIKKASPSKGLLREDFNHLAIAAEYNKNKVDAISVLTDEKYFKGSIRYLSDIAKIKKVPLLRKDFIIDEFQILEARANGADAVLLISELLDTVQIAELSHAAYDLGMSVLLEFHSPDQLDKINFEINRVIGINNRNLETFEVDINTSLEAAGLIPAGIIKTAESGIKNKTDVELIKNSTINAVLVGEYFMRREDIGAAAAEFMEWCRIES